MLPHEAHNMHSTHVCLVSGVTCHKHQLWDQLRHEPTSLGCRNGCFGGESLEFLKGRPMGKSPALPLNPTTRLPRLPVITLSSVAVSSVSFFPHSWFQCLCRTLPSRISPFGSWYISVSLLALALPCSWLQAPAPDSRPWCPQLISCPVPMPLLSPDKLHRQEEHMGPPAFTAYIYRCLGPHQSMKTDRASFKRIPSLSSHLSSLR